MTLSRAGQAQTVELTAGRQGRNYSLVKGERFDQLPQYYIYGGVVFVPLNMNLIKRWGRDWHNKAPVDFLHARNRWSSTEQQELVVALKVLASDVNLGYHDWKNWVIDSVNGQPISNFQQFCQLLQNPQGRHVIFKDDDGYQMVHRPPAGAGGGGQYSGPLQYSQQSVAGAVAAALGAGL